MKSLGNQARKEILSTGKITYSASAKETYQTEVASLTSKLNIALKNAPRKRQAQVMANSVVAAKKQDNPSMTTEEIKKAGQRFNTLESLDESLLDVTRNSSSFPRLRSGISTFGSAAESGRRPSGSTGI